MAAFFDYVRGRTNDLPPGYTEAGLRLYRHLTWLGVSQALEARYPTLRADLGEDAWLTLTRAFVRDATWSSPFYADLTDDFPAFLARVSLADDPTTPPTHA